MNVLASGLSYVDLNFLGVPRIIATVVLHDGSHAEAEELRAHVASQLARYKVPKEIAFTAKLPRTPSGKLLRRELSHDRAAR